MEPITNIKNLLSANAYTEGSDTVEVPPKEGSSLASAMKAVDDMIASSELIEAEAAKKVAGTTIAQSKPVLPDNGEKEPKLADEKDIDKPANKPEQSGTAESERRLCLHRKQKTLDKMREHIENSAALLSMVSKQSEQLVAYFGKAEIDLSHFEATEARSARAQELIAAISTRHKDMKLALTNQQQQIDMLQALKAKNRNTIERALAEVNRLNADLTDLQAGNKGLVFDVEKLKDDKNALLEQVDQLSALETESKNTLEETRQNLAAFQLQTREQERKIAGQSEMIRSLTAERDSSISEIKDLQSQLKSVHAKFTELQALLGEANHASQAAATDYEQKLRHRDTRILKLETENQTMKQQLIKTEEKFADLAHKVREQKILPVASNGEVHSARDLSEVSQKAVAATLN